MTSGQSDNRAGSKDLLTAINSEHGRNVIVGGLAMILQGSSYVTFSLDIAISPVDLIRARLLEHSHLFEPIE